MIFTYDFRSLHTFRTSLREIAMLIKLNKEHNGQRRSKTEKFLLTNMEIIKQVSLNTNNQDLSNSGKYSKPHFKYDKIIDNFPDDNGIHSKIIFYINPNLIEIQRN